jgi:cell division protease FtsH
MQYETIDADQIEDIMSGHKPRPPKDWRDQGPGNGAAASGDSASGDDPIGGPANTH